MELARSLGIPQNVSERWVGRSEFGTKRIDTTILAEQQKITDCFTNVGLIPRPINANDAIWKVRS